MLVSKQETRNLKLEYPASIYEPPCLPAGRDTSLHNDKRQFQFDGMGLVTITFEPQLSFLTNQMADHRANLSRVKGPIDESIDTQFDRFLKKGISSL